VVIVIVVAFMIHLVHNAHVIYTVIYVYVFFNETATTQIYTLSLHDALPISIASGCAILPAAGRDTRRAGAPAAPAPGQVSGKSRSEEHTSELQSLRHLVCRLLLEKKK